VAADEVAEEIVGIADDKADEKANDEADDKAVDEAVDKAAGKIVVAKDDVCTIADEGIKLVSSDVKIQSLSEHVVEIKVNTLGD